MAKMNMDMILNLKDKASASLKKFNANLDKTKAKLKETAKISTSIKAPSVGGSGADGGAGALGALGGTAALAGLASLNVLFIRMMSNVEVMSRSLYTMVGAFAKVNNVIKQGADAQTAWSMSAELIEEDLTKASKAINKATDGYKKLAKAQNTSTESTEDNTRATEKNTQGKSKWSRAFSGMGKIIGGVGAALAIVGVALTPIISVGREFEKLKATLSAVLPKTDNVGEAFAFIQKVSSQLPTTVEQTTTAFIRMVSLGLNPTEKSMISFGNTAAAMGKDILQFTEAVADASVGEFERLKEFGIKASKDGDEVAFTFQGITKTVKNNSREIVGYLEDIGNVQFAGAAAKQMDTLDGKLTNLGDAFDEVANQIFEGGLDDSLKSLVDVAIDVVNWFGKAYWEVRKFAASTIGLMNEIGVHATFIGRALKAAFTDLTLDEAVAKRDAELSAIKDIVAGMHAEYEAMKQNNGEGEKYAKVLQDRADKADAAAAAQNNLNNILVKGGHTLQTLNDFMADLSNETADEINNTNNLWAAQEKLDEWFQQGLVSGEEYTIMLGKLNEALGVTTDENEEAADEIAGFWQQAAANMQDAMGDTFFDWMQGKTSDMVGDFKTMIDRMVAELLASQLLNFLTGDFAATGNLGGFFGDLFRAEGGPVSANSPYIVGEQGPELFVPDSSGDIVPNGAMGGGGALTVNIQAMDSADVLRNMEKIQRPLAEMMSGTMRTYNLT